MLRARRVLKRILSEQPRNQVALAVGVTTTASLFLVVDDDEHQDEKDLASTSASVNNDLIWKKQQQQQKATEMKVVVPSIFPSSSYVECDSFPTRWFQKPKFGKSILDSFKESRSLNSTYDVDWETPLGEGGFGAVYPATNRTTKERVALKKISKEFTNDDDFQREMEALIAIRKAGGHPNLCGLHENFDEGDFYYLTLDLISGGEMFDHLINSGAYSEANAARLIREVASALSFLHGIGIVHGDLKPENLMLSTEKTSDSVVKVIDFGTAQVSNADGGISTAASTEAGTTPAYCPPEVLELDGEPAMRNPSMDCWALGIILYIMLVGAHPFDLSGNASDEIISLRVQKHKPPPLRGSPYTEHLSDSAIDLIEKLLAWDEDKRITADELLNHPWVRGITAKTSKIEDSDSKLSKLRPFKSRLEAKVFKDFISWSDEAGHETDASRKMSLIERSFRKFDTTKKGFITAKDVGKGLDESSSSSVGVDDDGEGLSLTGFSNLLSENMQNCFFKKGDILYTEGEIGKDMYFLNSGIVEVTTSKGFRTTLKQGDFVGEGALLSNKTRSGTVTCVTPVHAIRITKEYFEKYLAASDSALSLKMLETKKARDTSRKMFSGFSNLLKENMKNESFQRGDVIYREGQAGDTMLFIKSGVVSVTNKMGFHTTLKQGDFVGEGALLSNKPRSGTVTCLTPVEGMTITRDYFEKYMASSNTDVRLKMYEENKRRDRSRIRTILRQQKFLNNIRLVKDDLLYKEGDSTKNLYIVVDGEVDLEVGNVSAHRVRSGEICGAHSILRGTPRDSSARCSSSECNVMEIGPRAFNNLLHSSTSMRGSLEELCRQREFQIAVAFCTKKNFPKTEKELHDIFLAVQGAKKGYIVLKDVERLLRNLNPKIPDNEINMVWDAIDLGVNGAINFDTFKVIFTRL